MSGASLIRAAQSAGLKLTVSGTGTIKVAGSREAVQRLAPEITANKPAIIAELRQVESAQSLPGPRIRKEPPFGSDKVPARYLAAWQALLAQCPPGVAPFVWEAAIHDGAVLFGDFGRLVDEYRWAPNDLFAVPHDGESSGLAWFMKGSPVVALGRDMAQVQDGRIFRKARR